MRLDEMRVAHLGIIEDHIDLLKRVRAGEQPVPTPLDWAKSILSKAGAPITDGDIKKYLEAAGAVYCYEGWLWKEALSGKYDFDLEKHRGDFIDSTQLHYLADPQTHFLTADKQIAPRIKQSPKSSQIISYNEFVKSL